MVLEGNGGNKGTFNIDDVSYAAGLDGGLTVTGASVGTKQGFSIIKQQVVVVKILSKHGLGKVPKFVMAKDIDNSRAWYIYHGSLGANYRSLLLIMLNSLQILDILEVV